jgi:hypothetical protein
LISFGALFDSVNLIILLDIFPILCQISALFLKLFEIIDKVNWWISFQTIILPSSWTQAENAYRSSGLS